MTCTTRGHDERTLVSFSSFAILIPHYNLCDVGKSNSTCEPEILKESSEELESNSTAVSIDS